MKSESSPWALSNSLLQMEVAITNFLGYPWINFPWLGTRLCVCVCMHLNLSYTCLGLVSWLLFHSHTFQHAPSFLMAI